MFCAPRLIFGGNKGVGCWFHVLRSRSCFPWYRGCRVPFSSFALPDSFSAVPRASGPFFMFFGGTEGVVSRFHVLRSQTRFRRYGGRRLPFSCFARMDSFSAETRVPGVVFIFCAPEVVSLRTEGVGSHFQVLRSRTRFRRYRGHRVPFSFFARRDSFLAVPRVSVLVFMFLSSRIRFRRYRGDRVPVSCFARPESFSAETRVSAPIFMFCAPRVVSRGTEGVGSRFQVLRSRSRFWQYRGHRVLFSYFVLPNSFSAQLRASAPVFIFCAPEFILFTNA
jgi:hypothetical protein